MSVQFDCVSLLIVLIKARSIGELGAGPKVLRLPGTLVISPGKTPYLKQAKTVKIYPKKSGNVEKTTAVSSALTIEEPKKSSAKWPWIVGVVAAVGALIWLTTRQRKHRPLGRRRR